MTKTKAEYRAAIEASMLEIRRAMTTVADAIERAPAKKRKVLQNTFDTLGTLHYALADAIAAPPD
jgi:hypothetical protein